MIVSLTPTRVALLLVLSILSSQASSQSDPVTPKPHKTRSPKPYQPSFNPTLVLLDPAHGGPDDGGRIGPNLLEKDVNLAFAERLRSFLTVRGFTVQLTREADALPAPAPASSDPSQPAPPPQAPAQITPDQRAEQANRIHPLACILIHTTASGHGIHLFTSALDPLKPAAETRPIPLWDTAQAPFLPQSATLSGRLAEALTAQTIPVVTGRASVRPIDSMSCPAITLELAPLAQKGGKAVAIEDTAYQQRIAETLAEGLLHWRTDAEAILQSEAADAARAAARPVSPTPDKSAPKPKPRPKPSVVTPGHLVPGVIAPLPQIPQIVPPTTHPKPASPSPPVGVH